MHNSCLPIYLATLPPVYFCARNKRMIREVGGINYSQATPPSENHLSTSLGKLVDSVDSLSAAYPALQWSGKQ